ncbi:MAG: hypothetical protein JW940_00785, partial [Polyangiaceae bacterium]|nr:hypothetical protein [Polyangiaceae bacterium]
MPQVPSATDWDTEYRGKPAVGTCFARTRRIREASGTWLLGTLLAVAGCSSSDADAGAAADRNAAAGAAHTSDASAGASWA